MRVSRQVSTLDQKSLTLWPLSISGQNVNPYFSCSVPFLRGLTGSSSAHLEIKSHTVML